MPAAKYVLEIRSKSGKRLPGCTGPRSQRSPFTFVGRELKKRLGDAKHDPDLIVNYRKA